jgi:hypothetical protein
MRLFILISFLLLWAYAHTQDVTFSKVFSNFPLNPENGAIAKEIKGGYLTLSGFDCLGQTVKSCCMISKIDIHGEIVWFKHYPFRPSSNSLLIEQDKIYISGHTENEDKQFVLYCLDMEGNVMWNREYGDPSKSETFPRLLLTSDKHFILYGAKEKSELEQGSLVLYLLKTNMVGDSLTEYTYGWEHGTALVRTIIEDEQKNWVLSYGFCPPQVFCFLNPQDGVLRISPSGEQQWKTTFPKYWPATLSNVIQTAPNTLVANTDFDTITLDRDPSPPALYFLDTLGQVKDRFVFMSQTEKEIHSLAPLPDGGLVGGRQSYFDSTHKSLGGWIFRMRADRKIAWERVYTDTAYEGRTVGFQHIAPTSDGGYIAVGTIINRMTGVPESHNWLLKLDSAGCLKPSCGQINIITDTEEAVFLKGKDIRVWPNPSDDFIHVRLPDGFVLQKDVHIHLVSNSGGTVGRFDVSQQETRLDIAHLPEGIYYVVVSQGNEIIASKKVIVL